MGTSFLIAGLLAGVDPSLISALCYVESTHNVQAYVKHDGNSPSYGICQIKLATARDMGFVGTSDELMDPNTNALYAAKYLAWQKQRHGTWERAVSSYNAGRPVRSNAAYVRRVMTHYRLNSF